MESYADLIEGLPPVLIWRDDETGEVVLLDGRHRIGVRLRRGFSDVEASYFEGSRVEAEAQVWAALIRDTACREFFAVQVNYAIVTKQQYVFYGRCGKYINPRTLSNVFRATGTGITPKMLQNSGIVHILQRTDN